MLLWIMGMKTSIVMAIDTFSAVHLALNGLQELWRIYSREVLCAAPSNLIAERQSRNMFYR